MAGLCLGVSARHQITDLLPLPKTPDSGDEPSKESLSQQAYNAIEMGIVTTTLPPGSRTTLTQLEALSGLRRTPVHDAVKRLSTARLIHVLPRSGLCIAPLDLEEERLLLPVRIEMEAIACRLAAQRADAASRQGFVALIDELDAGIGRMSLADFNVIDNRLNGDVLTASGEMLLGNTLMPLQTLYRRSGWLFHARLGSRADLDHTIETHVDLLRTIVGGDPFASEQVVRSMLAGVYGAIARLARDNG